MFPNTPHIPLQPVMKLCKNCGHFEAEGVLAGQKDQCNAVVNPVYGTPIDAMIARSGQFCGLSGALFVKRIGQ